MRRLLYTFCLGLVAVFAHSGMSSAMPLAQAGAISQGVAALSSPVMKTGDEYTYQYNYDNAYGYGYGSGYAYRYSRPHRGCGWDYPCEPRPDYNRRSYSNPQVFIRNNYGTVNVYSNGVKRKSECGAFCWYKRTREGYCGHGCDYYRRRVGFEPGYKIVEYPRAYFYRSRPQYSESWRYERPYDDERVPLRRFEGPTYPAE